jgi:hypothetical protein
MLNFISRVVVTNNSIACTESPGSKTTPSTRITSSLSRGLDARYGTGTADGPEEQYRDSQKEKRRRSGARGSTKPKSASRNSLIERFNVFNRRRLPLLNRVDGVICKPDAVCPTRSPRPKDGRGTDLLGRRERVRLPGEFQIVQSDIQCFLQDHIGIRYWPRVHHTTLKYFPNVGRERQRPKIVPNLAALTGH